MEQPINTIVKGMVDFLSILQTRHKAKSMEFPAKKEVTIWLYNLAKPLNYVEKTGKGMDPSINRTVYSMDPESQYDEVWIDP